MIITFEHWSCWTIIILFFYVSDFRIAPWSSTAWTFDEQWVQNRTGGKSAVLPVVAVLVVVPTLLVMVTSDGCAGGPLSDYLGRSSWRWWRRRWRCHTPRRRADDEKLEKKNFG